MLTKSCMCMHVLCASDCCVNTVQSGIYWQSLNLAVCPQTNRKKHWRNLNLAVVSQVHLSRSNAVSRLRYLNKATNSTLVSKFTRNKTGSMLVPSMYSSCRGVPDGAKSATSLQVAYEIILVHFNLEVSIVTAKPPNLILSQIFRLYSVQ